jgi:hypothetical protein
MGPALAELGATTAAWTQHAPAALVCHPEEFREMYGFLSQYVRNAIDACKSPPMIRAAAAPVSGVRAFGGVTDDRA